MDAYTYLPATGAPAKTNDFIQTIKVLKRSAWNAYPCRHYYGMVTVEQEEGGWMVSVAPAGAGVKVNTTFYTFQEEEKLAMDVGRKMHPTLVCVCSGQNECFTGQCSVRP